REKFPNEHYHRGKELTRIEERGDGVTAHFADGSRADGDLIVGADGFRSTVRALVLPEIKPAYAGYVGWRGLAGQAALPCATHAPIFAPLLFRLPPNQP